MFKTSTLVGAIFTLFASAGAAGAIAQTPTPAPSPSVSPSMMHSMTPSMTPSVKATGPASPVPSASASASASPAATATPYKLITLQGSLDGGFTSVLGTDNARFVNGNPSRINDAATGPFFDANGGRLLAPANNFNNTVDLQNANLSMTLNGPFIGGKIEGSFGSDADYIASNGQSRDGTNLTQAYVSAAKGPITLIAGKFESLAGAEVIEGPNNSNYSRSYMFGDAVPFTHTGARVTYAYNSKISIVAGANNGWDDWKFDGKKKTLEGALLLTPSPGYALTLDTYNGNDFAVSGSSATQTLPVYSNRMLYDGVLTVHPTGALTLVANYDNGTQLADGTGVFTTAHWNGIAGYANYAFTPVYGISLRKETFHDADGFRTGFAQRLQSNTATINYSPGSNFIFRVEYRVDASDLPVFTYRGMDPLTDPGRQHQESIGVETIVKFP